MDIRIDVDKDFIRFVRDRLSGMYVTDGDIVIITMLGHSVPFNVIEAKPEGIALLQQKVQMNILREPLVQGYESKCTFQKRVSSNETICGLTVSEKEYNICLIDTCPIFQTWKLLREHYI